MYRFLSRNGFLWGPEPEIYGGVAGFYTYGPLGKLLKNNIEQVFRQFFLKEGFWEIQTPSLSPEKVWLASGHLEKFREEMFETATSSGIAEYLRPEMATSIYLSWPRLWTLFNHRLPVKLFQIGSVFPNDRQIEGIIRTREYTAIEGHIFANRKASEQERVTDYLRECGKKLMLSLGIPKGKLKLSQKKDSEKPFYARKAWKLEVKTKAYGWLEILGVQDRGNDDLSRHVAQSGKRLTGIELSVFEISFSSDRPFFVLIEEFLKEEKERLVFAFPHFLSPIQVGVLPIVKEASLMKLAQSILEDFQQGGLKVILKDKGSVGKRYREMDEKGVPYCLTVDQQSLDDQTMTVRNRDTRQQQRIEVVKVGPFLKNYLTNERTAMARSQAF